MLHPGAISPEMAVLFSAQGGATCSPAMSAPHSPSEFQVIRPLPTTQRHERKQRGDQFERSFLECWLWLAQCLCLPQGNPQCGTTIQNQPSVICRDSGACHPHHRESLNIPLMLSTFQSKQNKHQCLSRQNRGPCLNQMATWFVLSQWKYFGFQRWVPLSRGALSLLRTTGCTKRRCHRGGGGAMNRLSLEAGEDEKSPLFSSFAINTCSSLSAGRFESKCLT